MSILHIHTFVYQVVILFTFKPVVTPEVPTEAENLERVYQEHPGIGRELSSLVFRSFFLCFAAHFLRAKNAFVWKIDGQVETKPLHFQ